MANFFEFCDNNLNCIITIRKIKSESLYGIYFEAETVIDYYKYKSERILADSIFESMEISDLVELHTTLPPQVVVINQNTIMVSYRIQFVKSSLDLILTKEEVTPEKELSIQYQKHTDIINDLTKQIAELKDRVMTPIKLPKIITLKFSKERGLYFEYPDQDLENYFLSIMNLIFVENIYPTHKISEPKDWRHEYKNINELFGNVMKLFYNRPESRDHPTGFGDFGPPPSFGGQSNSVGFGFSVPSFNPQPQRPEVNKIEYNNLIFNLINTPFPYSYVEICKSYSNKVNELINDYIHYGNHIKLIGVLINLKKSEITLARIHVFATPYYEVLKTIDGFNEHYNQSVECSQIHPINWSRFSQLFGIYPNGFYNITENGTIYNKNGNIKEPCIVVWDNEC